MRRSFNCDQGNHGGCNQFHLGCQCMCHPRGKHLSREGRFAFVDVDTYPKKSLEDLIKHQFSGTKIGRHENQRYEKTRDQAEYDRLVQTGHHLQE